MRVETRRKKTLGRPRSKWKYNNKTELKEIVFDYVKLINSHDGEYGPVANFIKGEDFLTI
jgi:hypothetical protein